MAQPFLLHSDSFETLTQPVMHSLDKLFGPATNVTSSHQEENKRSLLQSFAVSDIPVKSTILISSSSISSSFLTPYYGMGTQSPRLKERANWRKPIIYSSTRRIVRWMKAHFRLRKHFLQQVVNMWNGRLKVKRGLILYPVNPSCEGSRNSPMRPRLSQMLSPLECSCEDEVEAHNSRSRSKSQCRSRSPIRSRGSRCSTCGDEDEVKLNVAARLLAQKRRQFCERFYAHCRRVEEKQAELRLLSQQLASVRRVECFFESQLLCQKDALAEELSRLQQSYPTFKFELPMITFEELQLGLQAHLTLSDYNPDTDEFGLGPYSNSGLSPGSASNILKSGELPPLLAAVSSCSYPSSSSPSSSSSNSWSNATSTKQELPGIPSSPTLQQSKLKYFGSCVNFESSRPESPTLPSLRASSPTKIRPPPKKPLPPSSPKVSPSSPKKTVSKSRPLSPPSPSSSLRGFASVSLPAATATTYSRAAASAAAAARSAPPLSDIPEITIQFLP